MSQIHSTESEKKLEIVETIVDAAERLLKSYGYQKMTMTDLAAEAGIGVGTTYLHFASKADVAVAVADRMHGRILAELTAIARANDAPECKLGKILWHKVNAPYLYVQDKLATMSWQQFNRHGTEFLDDIRNSSRSPIEVWKSQEIALIAEVIADGSSADVFLPVDPDDTARTMLAATCGFMPRHLDRHDFTHPQEFESKVQSVIRLLVSGIQRTKQQ